MHSAFLHAVRGLLGCWWEAAALLVLAAVSDLRPWWSLCSQATILQSRALSQRGHVPRGRWRVPLQLPLPLHWQALRDWYGWYDCPPRRRGSSHALSAQPPPALCPQVSRTPAPQGPARTGAPASTTSASTSATVPWAMLAGTARSVGVSGVCCCWGLPGGVLGLPAELTAVVAVSEPHCLL